MSQKLKISDDLSLPLEAVTQTFALLAKRGVGKTHTGSVMAEEMLKLGQPIVVYDPTGAWWGLKSSVDGKRPGYPVVVFGGEHADVPLEETAGNTIASVIVEKRIPAILDCGLMRKGARIRFMTDFCETLYHKNREALHFFVDEAQTIAPQNLKAMPEAARLLGAMEDIILQGRRRGLGMTIISPRPAVVNTSIRSACEVIMAMQIVAPHDRKAIQEWVDLHGDDAGRAQEMMDGLSSQKRGELWIWSPTWLEIFKKIKIRERETFDSSATPKVGEKLVGPKVLSTIDIDRLGQEIKATVDKVKDNDPKLLKAELAKVRAELLKAQQVKPGKTETKVVEKFALKDGQLSRAEALATKLEELFDKSADVQAELKFGSEAIIAAIRSTANQAPRPAMNRTTNPRAIPMPRVMPSRPVQEGDPKLGKCERAILSVLSQHSDGCQAGKLTLLTGYRFSGGFRNSISSLRQAGLIQGDNGGYMKITDAGLSEGPFDQLPSGKELIVHWTTHSSFGGCERKILEELIAHPEGLTADELCNSTGYQFSGGFRNGLSALRTAGVIVGKNGERMRASQELLDAAQE